MKAFKYKREDDYFYAVMQNDFEIKGIKNKLEDIRNDNEYDIQGSLLSHEMILKKRIEGVEFNSLAPPIDNDEGDLPDFIRIEEVRKFLEE